MPNFIKQKVYVLEFFQNVKPININNIDFVNIDTSIDNVSVHLKNGNALFTKWSNVKNQCDVKSLHKSDSDLELEMELS
jgi:hypothetical protein|tara:strand:+ start:907 stop:1143 length:237 start_codon:yes stop_codon:yes gene_type:complete